MNFTKSLVTFSIVSSLLISCKDTASKPTTDNNQSTTTKKNTVVVKPETVNFKIQGTTCAMGCAKTIETKLSKMDGVQKATVDFDKKEATVDFDASVLSSEKITKAVESTGDGETYKVSDLKTKDKV
jgi:hypothetical protein